MAANAQRLCDKRAEDALLVRGVARGDEHALQRLLAAHADAIYGLLRMVLPTATQAEDALCVTFAEAGRRAGEERSRRDPANWLIELALDEVAARSAPGPIMLERARRMREREVGAPAAQADAANGASDVRPEILEGINDRALAVLIRSVELRSRQALVLRTTCGLDDRRIAEVIGCRAEQVDELAASALGQVRARLAEHERREEELRRHIAAVPYQLGTLADEVACGNGRDVDTVVKGIRVYVEPRKPLNPLMLMLRVIKRILERLRDDELDLDDEVGGHDNRHAKGLDPTPTAQPFERPGATPSTQGYRQPALSRGVAAYRTPKATPTTRRLSNPGRPMPAGVSWSSVRNPRHGR